MYNLFLYNSLPCRTESYLGRLQASGQRPRKVDISYSPDAFNPEGEPRSEIPRDSLFLVGHHIALKHLIITLIYFCCKLWIYVLLDA